MPILIIEIALVLLYFSVNSFVSTKIADTFLTEASGNMSYIAEKESKNIDMIFRQVSKHASILQDEHEYLFKNLDQSEFSIKNDYFMRSKSGFLYKEGNAEKSSLYYSGDTKIGIKELKKAYLTEKMDKHFRAILKSNDLITQIYFNSYDNMNRIYPPTDVKKSYPPAINMEDYNFYYMADLKNNPKKKAVWTEAYLDPAGSGWLVSCIVPIYNGDFLEGVTGIDITINNLINKILNLSLPYKSNAFLVDHKGMILAINPSIEKILSLKELKDHVYKKSIDKTVIKPDEFNILNSPDDNVRSKLGHIFKNRIRSSMLKLGDEEYLVTQNYIDETDWHLFVLTNKNTLVSPIDKLEKFVKVIGYSAVITLIIFFLIFFFFIMKKSGKVASSISSPVSQLSESTKHITEMDRYDYNETSIEEINQLNYNFSNMVSELSSKTSEIIRMEVERIQQEKEAEKLMEISRTDALTKIANRLKLDELLEYEMGQSCRYNTALSIILLDIDFFKNVNDIYGHQAGDEVLIKTAALLTMYTRNTDTVGRWGGEEFLILCPQTSLEEAATLAEKLRCTYENYDFPIEEKLTASFGVTQFIKNDTRETFIKRADVALYKAKNKSRNAVVTVREMISN